MNPSPAAAKAAQQSIAVTSLAADVRTEQDELMDVLSGLGPQEWTMPSAAAGWSIRDQVIHLAYFDSVTALAGSQPEAFLRIRETALVDLTAFVERALAEQRSLGDQELLGWWRVQRDHMLTSLTALPANARLPWFGPAMSVRSKLTARLMETWAHGQDVIDVLGVSRPATDRLKHIAHLGVGTFGHSFQTAGVVPPEAAVYVELTAPGGELWTWGEPGADERVAGPAEEFCLVVTQRRDVTDTSLVTQGAIAAQWMEVAQAFAGPQGARPSRKGRKNVDD